MANFKNTVYDYYDNVKETLPPSSAKSGTIETVGKIMVGTGTSFLSELQVGGWVFVAAQDEIRKVVDIQSDTKATLSDAFTADLAPASPLVGIRFIDAKAISLSASVPSAALTDALIDTKTLVKGTSVTFDARDSKDYSGNGLVDPIIVDATGTTVEVMYQRS